jgi:hypothetical protein
VNKKFKPVIVETPQSHAAIRGRGASWSPANRFEKLHVDLTDADVVDVVPETEEAPIRRTQYFRDGTRTIITRNTSPDVGFETSLNPYRGASTAAFIVTRDRLTSISGFRPVLISKAKSWSNSMRLNCCAAS